MTDNDPQKPAPEKKTPAHRGLKFLRDWAQRNLEDPQVVVLILVLVLAVLTLTYFGRILAPVLLALMLAYLVDSIVVVFQSRGLPRLPVVLVLYSLFLALFIGVLFILVPVLSRQISQIPVELPAMFEKVEAGLRDVVQRYDLFQEDQFEEWLSRVKQNLQGEINALSLGFGKQLIETFRGAVVILVYTILVPILVFFMLKDKQQILSWFNRFVPQESRLTRQVWSEVDSQIGNYIRGKVWEILIIGGACFLVFQIFGLNYAPLLALLVGLSVVIPYVGATLVTFPVFLVAYAQWGFDTEFAKVFVAYMVIQVLDGNLLVPLLFGEVNKLHPIAIIVAVLIFGGLWGVWGVFFAIPLATLVQAIIRAWPRRGGPLVDPGATPS